MKITDDIFKSIFNESVWISITTCTISLKFIPKGPIDYKSALVQVVAWHRTGEKPLPESMLTQFTDAYTALAWGWNEHWYSEARVCLGVTLSGYSEAKHAEHRSTLGKPGHTLFKCIFTHIYGLHQLSKYSHFNGNTFCSWCNGSHLCNPCSSERPRWMCLGDIKEFV